MYASGLRLRVGLDVLEKAMCAVQFWFLPRCTTEGDEKLISAKKRWIHENPNTLSGLPRSYD